MYIINSTNCTEECHENQNNMRGGGLVFCFVQIFFFGQHELEYLFFLSRNARIFFPEINIRLWQKLWIRLFFFSPPKSEYLFQQHWESEYFLRKNQVKWSVPNLVEIWLPKKFTALYLQPKYQNTTIISIYNSIIITLIFIFHGNSEPDTSRAVLTVL
jgi:hypothetical protein